MLNKELPAGYPTWADKFYFRDILRKDYSQQFKVIRFNVGPVNAKGENFASSMFRVKLTIENSETGLTHRNFIVKANLHSELSTEIIALFNVFPKEIQMYTEILPKFESFYKAIGETVRFAPLCLVGTQEPADLIIMDDLCLQGYRSADRVAGLDWDHVRLTITKLAKMHAASAVFIEKGSTFDKKYNEGIHSEAMRPIMDEQYDKSGPMFDDIVGKWKCAHILDKYQPRWKDIMLTKLYEIIKRKDDRFNVLCHGDLWCNNVMFKYNEDSGKVEDCLLVDYQMCFYNTPMLDLHYFIYTSTQHNIKMQKVDHIIQLYHQELVANLRKLGYSKRPPTLLELQKDFLDVGLYGLVSTFGTFCIAVAPASDDSEMASFFKDDATGDNFKRRLFSNPIYVSAMEDLIPFFEKKGFFDG